MKIRAVLRGEQMKKTKVLVVDDNKSLVGMIKEYFKENSNITISLEAYDGTD